MNTFLHTSVTYQNITKYIFFQRCICLIFRKFKLRKIVNLAAFIRNQRNLSDKTRVCTVLARKSFWLSFSVWYHSAGGVARFSHWRALYEDVTNKRVLYAALPIRKPDYFVRQRITELTLGFHETADLLYYYLLLFHPQGGYGSRAP